MASAPSLHRGLPDEIIFWEILVRLPPRSLLLQCRPVCRSWHRVTSTRGFLLAHHARQPSLPIVRRFGYPVSTYQTILAFDHRAAAAADVQLQPVARLLGNNNFSLEASCDGLLVLSRSDMFGTCFTVCNPATGEHAPPLKTTWDVRLLAMYLHRPTGEYRLLLHRSSHTDPFFLALPQGKDGCYTLALGSDQPLRYIGGVETVIALQLEAPALVRNSMHWYQAHHGGDEGEQVLVFDTTTELFRQMRPPPVVLSPTTNSAYVFETEGALGISSHNHSMKIVDIWVLRNYEDEVWERKYRVELPVVEIRRRFGSCSDDYWHVSVVSVDGHVLLLLRLGLHMLHVDTGGRLVGSFYDDSQQLLRPCEFRLKQSLVPHSFFTALEGHGVNHSPFV